ncbi:MAG: DUF4153 domain-containing protein [Clostridiaceae bacterium]|nr:DUF4153 domain-containing protein [Clostridiaceae bacterium]
MAAFPQAIRRVLSGGARSLTRFSASSACAILIAVIATIRIWDQGPEPTKLVDSLQLALLLAGVLAMALALLAARRQHRTGWLIGTNLAALVVAAAGFLLLYLPSGEISIRSVSWIAALTLIAFLFFLLQLSARNQPVDFNLGAYMTLKAAVVAAVYALVLIAGLLFTAFAVESLLYPAMDEKIYLTLVVWSLFVGYVLFLGYFPDLNKGQADPQLAVACSQPRFISLLFANILIPLTALLSLVLLIWALQVLIGRQEAAFSQLSVIFSAYVFSGIFLMIMTSRDDRRLTGLFHRIFPAAALLFLAFEAYAWIRELQAHGLQTGTYFAALVWLFAVSSAGVLLVFTVERARMTAWIAAGLALLAVLPLSGFLDAPGLAQTARLKSALVRNQMFVDGRIEPARQSVSPADKALISDAAFFLLTSEGWRADWFTTSLNATSDFQRVFGFPYTKDDQGEPQPATGSFSLLLPVGTLPVSAYEQVAFVAFKQEGESLAAFTRQSDHYRVVLNQAPDRSTARLLIEKNSQVAADVDLEVWLAELAGRYAGTDGQAVVFDDMLVTTVAGEVKLTVVFQSIYVAWSEANPAERTYMLQPLAVFLGPADP